MAAAAATLSRAKSDKTNSSIKIPVVDLAAYQNVEDGKVGDERRAVAAAALAEACHSPGFVAVRNHGIPETLVTEAFGWAARLFALPRADKMKAPHPPASMPHRGYSAPGTEKVYSRAEALNADGEIDHGQDSKDPQNDHAQQDSEARNAVRGGVTDYKESFEIGSEQDPYQTNIWLPEEVLPGFRAFTTAFYWECNGAADVLLGALADGLKLDALDRETLLSLNSRHCNQLRLLHYPPVGADELAAGVLARMPAHTDWGTATMLFQDNVGGLELQDPATGAWIPAVPDPEHEDVTGGTSCIVNVADFLERVTNGHLKSAMHRVTLPSSSNSSKGVDNESNAKDENSNKDGNVPEPLLPERYSIPYFVGPPPDLVGKSLAPFVTLDHPAKYDPLTFAEYAEWRNRHSY